MKFIQKNSLKDHLEKKHKNENLVSNMEESETADINLLELKDFSLQEYLNQSYDKVESLSTAETKPVTTASILSENFKVVTESIPNNNNNNCVTTTSLDQCKVSLQPQQVQSAKQFELLSVVDNEGLLSNTSPVHSKPLQQQQQHQQQQQQASTSGASVSVNNFDLFDMKEEKLDDDISIFFEELEGQYPTLRTVDTDGVVIKEEKQVDNVSVPQMQTVTFQACPPRYSDVANTVNIQVSSLTPANPPPSYQEAVTLSSSDAQTFQLLSSSEAAPTISLPAAAGSSSQPASSQFFVTEGGQQSATVSLSFQDELNEFCEGILNQIESSDWETGLSVGGNSSVNITFNTVDNTSSSHPSLSSTLDESSNLSAASSQVLLTGADTEPPPVDPDDPSWVTGRSSLPGGWKMRMVDMSVGTRQIKKSHFLSPSGHYFDSRKSAIDHMIRTHSYSEDDIETMKKGLREKSKFDWSSSRTDIPRGWKTREKLSSDGKTRVFYLSPGGISFPCRLAAYEHMVKDGGYSIADIELMKIGAKNKRNKGKDFTAGDPSLPFGWKVRINAQQKESFRSPHGVFFHSRQSVLDHLIQVIINNVLVSVEKYLTLDPRCSRRHRASEEQDTPG